MPKAAFQEAACPCRVRVALRGQATLSQAQRPRLQLATKKREPHHGSIPRAVLVYLFSALDKQSYEPEGRRFSPIFVGGSGGENGRIRAAERKNRTVNC